MRHEVNVPQERQETSDRYVAAYRELPETAEEIAFVYYMSREALAGEPWE